ncbi:hypothetical protein [Leptothoe spongobia]|uniref:Uncharacterized protein n=1 Tax=Leptothoe spongobia TAU-MAC 1115 TaxID=1967444 RepID=A0A947GIK7_9CYAN|nr:hypothetical protein [Leptothoe spongobia]MBT9316300.1 hypothetical protein [Leptothoe spongobia TAU-MAC 1115]
MGIEFGGWTQVNWWAGYPVDYQLWQDTSHSPGSEVSLVATLARNLTLTVRSATTTIQAWTEADADFPAVITVPERGLVQVSLPNDMWLGLSQAEPYWLDISAYGQLRLSQQLRLSLPESGSQIVNGVGQYGSPRQVLEVIGQIPGASTRISVDISNGWTQNEQGYWTRTFSTHQPIFGLWVNDRHSLKVDYADLATTHRGHAIAESSGSYEVFYNGPEELGAFDTFVETAFSIYVWRCLKEATAEIDRKTGRFFNQRLMVRDPYRGRYRQHQLIPKVSPITADNRFRLDTYSRSYTLVRRYTQEDLVQNAGGPASVHQRIHLEPKTGMITVAEAFWDWFDHGFRLGLDDGIGALGRMPQGEWNLELTYTGGYEKTPVDIDEGCANLAAIRQAIFWQQALTQGMSAISIGCTNLNFGDMTSRWFPSWQAGADAAIAAHQSIYIEEF